jgi:hypothetical protein
MKEVQEEQELRYDPENLMQVRGTIKDVQGREQLLKEQVAQLREDVIEREKEAATEKVTEEKFSTDLHCLKYQTNEGKRKGCLGRVRKCFSIERGTELSSESDERIDPSIV